MLEESLVDEVRRATDIVDLIGKYTNLVPMRGKSSYFGWCPLGPPHQHARLSVWPQTQTFKCFECGRGGSVFHFLMELSSISFQKAVEFCAKKAGKNGR
jgi:DNA primase